MGVGIEDNGNLAVAQPFLMLTINGYIHKQSAVNPTVVDEERRKASLVTREE